MIFIWGALLLLASSVNASFLMRRTSSLIPRRMNPMTSSRKCSLVVHSGASDRALSALKYFELLEQMAPLNSALYDPYRSYSLKNLKWARAIDERMNFIAASASIGNFQELDGFHLIKLGFIYDFDHGLKETGTFSQSARFEKIRDFFESRLSVSIPVNDLAAELYRTSSNEARFLYDMSKHLPSLLTSPLNYPVYYESSFPFSKRVLEMLYTKEAFERVINERVVFELRKFEFVLSTMIAKNEFDHERVLKMYLSFWLMAVEPDNRPYPLAFFSRLKDDYRVDVKALRAEYSASDWTDKTKESSFISEYFTLRSYLVGAKELNEAQSKITHPELLSILHAAAQAEN